MKETGEVIERNVLIYQNGRIRFYLENCFFVKKDTFSRTFFAGLNLIIKITAVSVFTECKATRIDVVDSRKRYFRISRASILPNSSLTITAGFSFS